MKTKQRVDTLIRIRQIFCPRYPSRFNPLNVTMRCLPQNKKHIHLPRALYENLFTDEDPFCLVIICPQFSDLNFYLSSEIFIRVWSL